MATRKLWMVSLSSALLVLNASCLTRAGNNCGASAGGGAGVPLVLAAGVGTGAVVMMNSDSGDALDDLGNTITGLILLGVAAGLALGGVAAASSHAQCTEAARQDVAPLPVGEIAKRQQAIRAPVVKRVFVTSQRYDGNLGGLIGAQAKCQTTANDAGLSGRWTAWLSTPTANAVSGLEHVGPWARVDGKLVFANLAALVDANGVLSNGLWVDESGVHLASAIVWTGTGATGRYTPRVGGACQAWTSSSPQHQSRIGLFGRTDAGWTSYSFATCDRVARLVCFEQ